MPVNKATSKAGASAKRSRAHGSGLSSDEEESRSAQHKKQLASKNKKTLGSTKTNKRQQRSHGPTKSNPQDLFQKLSHDEVFLILSYLEPADFEALRRTSKLWKATSELHCGRTFLLKHFPSTPLPSITLKDGLSKRDADAQYHGACNLLYRRAFYHRQSFARGTASRATNFTGVKDWDLNNHRVVYTDLDRIWVRTLRNETGDIFHTTEPKELFLNESRFGPNQIVYVQITKEGDLLVTTCSDAASTSRDGPDSWDTCQFAPVDYSVTKFLVQIATPEMVSSSKAIPGTNSLGDKDTIIFKLNFAGSKICKPAIGLEDFYFVQNLSAPSTETPSQPRFSKALLSDGSVVYSTPIPEFFETGSHLGNGRIMNTLWGSTVSTTPTAGPTIEIDAYDTSLSLIKNEAAAIWSPQSLRVYIFSTSTGSLIYTLDRQSKCPIVADPNSSGFWYSGISRATPLDTYGPPYTVYVPLEINEKVSKLDFGRPAYCPGYLGVVNNERPMGIQAIHSDIGIITGPGRISARNSQALDAFMSFELLPLAKHVRGSLPRASTDLDPISNLFTGPTYDVLDKNWPSKGFKITLPRTAERDKARRPLEVQAPRWKTAKEECRLVEGYLVQWMPDHEQLLLIDFFPKW